MPSNPIQQRVEIITEQWEASKIDREARVVRFRCQPDEEDMIDAFYTYMIAVDTPILDIAFHFDAHCIDEHKFSIALLNELEEVIDIWNNSQKDKKIDYVPVNWNPDYSLATAKNPATVFVENFNRLAAQLDLQADLYAVAIFRGEPHKPFISWLEHAVRAGISSRVRFVVCDTICEPVYLTLAKKLANALATIPVNLDMPTAIEQVAAMGDPQDPATAYRTEFMKMMNAMNAGNEASAEKHAQACIDIATANLSRDPYWVMQIVVVNIAIGNDKIRYKRKQETLAYAHRAVDTAIAAQDQFDNQMGSGLLAQSLMFRGTVYFVQKQFNESYSDFQLAFVLFREQNNGPLAVEASRMAAKAAFKAGYRINAIKTLAEGAKLGRLMDAAMARSSSFAGVLELLLPTPHEPYIPYTELEEMGRHIYGDDWKQIVYNWRRPPEKARVQNGIQTLESYE